MSNLSNYLANAILAFCKGTAFPSAPTNLYAALYNGDPGADGTGGTDITSTISSGGRVEVDLGTVTARAVSNNAVVDFGSAIAGATADHVAIWDAHTGGNCLWSGALSASKTITTGAPVSFPIGTMSFSFA